MIGFFRRIRKKLADDNQFIKYSRYAIGEIVLVMVGILLALQVNNWNEGRKNMSEENELLEALLLELDKNNENINKSMLWLETIKKTGLKSIDIWTSESRIDVDVSIDEIIGDLCWFMSMGEFESDVVNTLVLEGKLQLIQNSELRKEIRSWRKNMSLLEKVVVQDYDHFSTAWMPYLRKNANVLQLSNAIKTWPNGEPVVGIDYSLGDKRINHSRIIQDPEFQNLVQHKIWIQEDIMKYLNKLQAQLETIVGMVKPETNS